ncbi:hypothetical protein [Vibrio owensii]|uniref:hypothetical protein n=1 Tax=Vibrio owensii TaxID=696485 RepID=UPI00221FEF6E|nr:hypothetical protein [Vibrio owensii]
MKDNKLISTHSKQRELRDLKEETKDIEDEREKLEGNELGRPEWFSMFEKLNKSCAVNRFCGILWVITVTIVIGQIEINLYRQVWSVPKFTEFMSQEVVSLKQEDLQ